MDAKALAKSKRAHTQHHSKNSHGGQKTKSHSFGAQSTGNPKKPSGSQIADKTKGSWRLAMLPTNWDRYGDEAEPGQKSMLMEGTEPSDIILPKSKGADYHHIVAEAWEEKEMRLNVPESFGSLDDILSGEFGEALSYMLSARGDGILSWMGDENFVVEDEKTQHHEAPFLSLNLHALAEKLEEVDLHRRLFIEEDMLPLDLDAEEHKECNAQGSSDLKLEQGDNNAVKALDELIAPDISEEHDIACEKPKSLSLAYNNHQVEEASQLTAFNQDLTAREPVEKKLGFSGSGALGAGKKMETNVELNSECDIISKKRPSVFKASSAEAELDNLLGSSVENSLTDAFKYHVSGDIVLAQRGTSNLLHKHSTSLSVPPIPLAFRESPAFDDVLDDLLEETSRQAKHDVDSTPPRNEKPTSSTPVRKSKLLDDFDSWLDTI